MNIVSLSGNSLVKEGFRRSSEADAQNEELALRQQLQKDLSVQQYINKPAGAIYGVSAVVCACIGIGLGGFLGFLGGIVSGLIIVGVISLMISASNKSIDERKAKMSAEAEKKIEAIWQKAQQNYQNQCNRYDSDVKIYSKKILGNASNVSPMVDHSAKMFERMISHADSGSNHRFIETNFTYKVENSGISYNYDSRYSNSMDDFDFSHERFHNIGSPAECEGLARALAKLIIAKMMMRYPRATTTITHSHVDAEVTLHFKGANSNFVPARDIY